MAELLAATPADLRSDAVVIPSMAEVLKMTTPAGYEQKGKNCDCNLVQGVYVYQYYQTKRTPQLCATACTADPTCASFGFYCRDSPVKSWRGMCFLYGALCPDTDGHAATNTCPHPAHKDTSVVNFNKLPTPAPTTTTPMPTPPTHPPTPAPTLAPGLPCLCDDPCGYFPLLDTDSDGCIKKDEAEKSESIKKEFKKMDADKDGCVTKAECDASNVPFDSGDYPVPSPGECDYGYYAPKKASVCLVCTGGQTRRRRSDECTECPAGRFDAGDYDDCLAGVWVYKTAEIGDEKVYVNSDRFENGMIMVNGTGITIATRNPDYYEMAIVVGKVGFGGTKRLADPLQGQSAFRVQGNSSVAKYIELDHPLKQPFYKYDAITAACKNQDGSKVEADNNYPCGCGRVVCQQGYACDKKCAGEQSQNITGEINGSNSSQINGSNSSNSSNLSYGDTGCCIDFYKAAPTPVPTVSAIGDPHLVNLQGEHFDINHAGEFTLLRIPQSTDKAAEVLLQATIRPEHGKPCTTYITEVEFSGLWFHGKSVQVRSYLRDHAKNGTDKFFGVRVLEEGLDDADAPWHGVTDWEDSMVLHQAMGPEEFEVILSRQSWSSKKSAGHGGPTMAGQFTITFQGREPGSQLLRKENTKITVRQDIPSQEHLNLAVRKLGKLARVDVGGLLGFDSHPESLEEVTQECERHRMGLDHAKGPKSQPAWKTRWSKIKARHHTNHFPGEGGEDMNDNEAAASLIDKMCVCEERWTGLDEGEGEEMALIDAKLEAQRAALEIGVIVDLQTARLAEASWE